MSAIKTCMKFSGFTQLLFVCHFKNMFMPHGKWYAKYVTAQFSVGARISHTKC